MQCENAESHEKYRNSEVSRDQIPGKQPCGQREKSTHIERLQHLNMEKGIMGLRFPTGSQLIHK